MAPSFDYAETSLLCAEEDTSIFDEVVDNCGDDLEISCNWQHISRNNMYHQEHNFMVSGVAAPMMQSSSISEECLISLLGKEREHLPAFHYLKRLRCGDLDLGSRKEAIDWIHKVQSHYNFGPLCVYLAVNYLDRFLSTYELPKGKDWMMQLLAVACLALAAKMEETDVPLSLDLQVGEAKFIFEAKTIQRMELLVLSTLKWRMQAVTPFSYIDYFLYRINGNQMPPRSLILQCIQIILSTIKGIDFLEFRPSEIAAAVAISVTRETQIVERPDKAFSFLSEHVQKERLDKCAEMIHDFTLTTKCKGPNGSTASTSSVPQSPIGVLDAACMSYKSDDTSTATTPSGSCANSVHNSPIPNPKRRKVDRTLEF